MKPRALCYDRKTHFILTLLFGTTSNMLAFQFKYSSTFVSNQAATLHFNFLCKKLHVGCVDFLCSAEPVNTNGRHKVKIVLFFLSFFFGISALFNSDSRERQEKQARERE